MKEKLQKISAVTFVGIFCIFIFIAAASKENNSKPQENYRQNYNSEFDKEFHGKADVIDGDSLKVDDGSEIKEVRLFGIDAPEYSQTCFDESDKEYTCGNNSQKFLVDLIDKKQITCFYSQKDVYNRFLAICEIDRISINQEILKNGMALIYNFNQSDEVMKELEKSARISKIGIWQGKFQKPKDYRKSHPHK
jgi:endonuclease YncB( thermonuclease family)